MANIKIFIKDLEKFNKQIEDDLTKLHKEVAFQILKRFLSHGRFVGSTPVDTGRAIANWRIDINKIDTGTTEKTDPSGQSVLTGVMNKIAILQPFEIIWISNNLPYINRLMIEGYSKQTPPGAVQLTIAEVIQFLRNKYQ